MKRRDFIASTLSVLATSQLFSQSNLPDLPKILILGDSISIGYTPFVIEHLKGKAEVTRPYYKNGRAENCQGTSRGVTELDRWLGDTEWDIIHFNFGLHDLKHVDADGKNSKNSQDPQQADLKTYKSNLEDIVLRLKQTNARLIFATTTPYPDFPAGPLRRADQPKKYNKVAMKIMKKNSIEINDLYSFVLPRMEELMIPNNVHFTKEGSEILANEVVKYLTVN